MEEAAGKPSTMAELALMKRRARLKVLPKGNYNYVFNENLGQISRATGTTSTYNLLYRLFIIQSFK